MELLKKEKQLAGYASLIITNNRLLQNKKNWMGRTQKEIPLKYLTRTQGDKNGR